MALRFRKSFKVAPGMRVNLSLKRGASVSVGGNGLTHNIGLDGKSSTTVSAPGTGLSYTTSQRAGIGSGWALLAAAIVLAPVVASCVA